MVALALLGGAAFAGLTITGAIVVARSVFSPKRKKK